MTDPCFFLADVGVPVGGLLRLGGPEGRHAAKVRRIRVGESVLVMDGRGHAVRGLAELIGDAQIDLRVVEVLCDPPSDHRWVAVQALAKGGRDEAAVESLTELGVDEIIAWQASRSIVRWQGKDDKGLAKWSATAREAAKQARRFSVPPVSYLATPQLCQRIKQTEQTFVMHETADEWLSPGDVVARGEVMLVIGPEGGIAPDELAAFVEAGALVRRIATNVLRTSTAGVVALSQLQVLGGAR